MAPIAAVLALASSILLLRDINRRLLARIVLWGGLLLGLAIIILAKSRASFGAFSASVLLVAVLKLKFRQSLILVSVTFGVASVLLFVSVGIVGDLPVLVREAATMGRSDPAATKLVTLTGRTELWSEMLRMSFDHPFVGFGYHGFWTTARIAKMATIQDWVVASSHSSYVATILHFGWIGFAFFLAMLVSATAQAMKSYVGRGTLTDLFFLGVIVFISVNMLLKVILFETTIPSLLALIVIVNVSLTERLTRCRPESRVFG